ncbi:3',5'-cyclic AMP phosphodiesterase CpdA [Kitasatospora gansuensis]|uniref:3',5'-cyclic AMP phosphodiesterase CpdA n=1 Tax=Kitasatospora gansuensis TaxID=258050 RepID=A0A7W7S9S8_9ACTN|nr:metallophosphoesterase [Kitasatospora gansuensis]MBB4945908.1 3',5'-cyclic AMP phosphodiesterase CpdA [Kitasatospora gansuensis]
MIVIAHLSDTHLDGSQRATDRTKAVLDHLNGLPYDLDAVLVTGDIADHGRPAEYALARELLGTRHPLLVLPGNHDDRAAFRAGLLGEEPSAEPVNRLHVTPGFAVALCDSTIPGRDDGHLDDATLAWLDKALGSVEVPTLVAFHHPPVLLGIPYLDGLRQFGGERLAELTERHPHVAGFLCGHAHLAAVTTFAGRPLTVAPGVVSTARLPWESRPNPDAHVHHDLPPALAFHVLDDEGRLTTHIRSC